jgi:DedD protein
MGLLSIFQRNKQTAATPAKSGRAGRASARQPSFANSANSSNPVESAEAVREARARARRRLMGATVLLLIGVIGFPLLFETQPRPIPVDLPIEIPARNAAGGVDIGATTNPRPHRAGASTAAALPSTYAPAAVPASGIAPESVSYDARQSAPSAPAPAPAGQPARKSAFASLAAALTPSALRPGAAASTSTPPPMAGSASVPQASVAQTRNAAKPLGKPAASAAATSASVVPPAAANPPRAQAMALAPAPASTSTPAAPLAGATATKASDAAGGANRFVVQVGAFAEDAKLRDVRTRVEKIGLKTYTQAVDTPAGKRVRVRVGPYATRAEADKTASKIKADGLPAAVLAL